MMPREIFQADGHLQNQIAGTGPFQLDTAASQKGTRYTWKKNPAYWEQGKPYLDEVRWIIMPDDPAAYAAFKAKQLDILGFNIEAGTGDQIAKENPGAVAFPFLEQGAAQLYINTREAPFNDLRVRKALSLGIDREEFVRVRTAGKGRVGMAGAPSGGGFFTVEETKQLMRYDPDQAGRLIKEAGYPNGVTLRMTYPGTAYGDGYITSLQLLQAQLKKVGMNIDLVNEDKNAFSDNRKKAQFTINLIEGASLDGDVDSWLYSTWYPGSKANYNGVDDPKLKQLLDAEVAAVDPAKRKELIREALRYLNTETYAGVSIYHGVDHHFSHPWVKNYRPNFWIDGYPVTNVWVER
jgi:peptide/nickel transport system substrate-binding protein